MRSSAKGGTRGASSPPPPQERLRLEHVRREIRLGRNFDAASFERAFATFAQMYNVAPQRALCAPDVLTRFCELFETSPNRALEHSARLRYDGVPLVAAILSPGVVAFEGEVDEDRMGDW